MIVGALEPDFGEIVRVRSSSRVALLSQEFGVRSERTIREEFHSVFEESIELVARREAIHCELEAIGDDLEKMGPLLDELAVLDAAVSEVGTDLIASKVDQVAKQLGFRSEDLDRLVASFSGGWQMRVGLGKALLKDPDVLLLDEPTNHLDLGAISWLEEYLAAQELPMVIVSHDREFLDQLCTKIVETEQGRTTTYPGNYTAYRRQKEDALMLQWEAYDRQQKEIAKQKELIARLSAGARSGRASTAAKALERLRSDAMRVRKPFVPKRRRFSFPQTEHMGQIAVEACGLTHGYGGKMLFADLNLVLRRGERLALLGPNGAGKSTLLRLIMGQELPRSGGITMGKHAVSPNYFAQNQAEALDPAYTVMQTLELAAPDARRDDIKALLGRMLFSGAAVDKKVEWLSGGEKARLALAKFMLSKGSLLVLDEPTNHLDIPSKEMLEEALQAFEGSAVIVSHDRYFIKNVATRILTIDDGAVTVYDGDYEFFLSKHAAEASVMAAKRERQRKLDNALSKSKSKRINSTRRVKV